MIIVTASKVDNLQYTILLPADAGYSHIDLSRHDKLHGLVATHHGASSHNCLLKIPKASFQNILVYSYGKPNTFGHPTDLSQEKHKKKGWYNDKLTIKGDILMRPEPTRLKDILEKYLECELKDMDN